MLFFTKTYSCLLNQNGKYMSNLIIHENSEDPNDKDNEDDDNQFIIEEIGSNGVTNTVTNQSISGACEANEDHGGLVTKLLQSKKEFESENLINIPKLDAQVGNFTDISIERERVLVAKEIETLCESLQALSRSSLHLGKFMGFIQEDIECMQQEFDCWKNENQRLEVQLKHEETLNYSSMEPLKAQLLDIEQIIEEKQKTITKYKSKILHNDERIQSLLFKSMEIV